MPRFDLEGVAMSVESGTSSVDEAVRWLRSAVCLLMVAPYLVAVACTAAVTWVVPVDFNGVEFVVVPMALPALVVGLAVVVRRPEQPGRWFTAVAVAFWAGVAAVCGLVFLLLRPLWSLAHPLTWVGIGVAVLFVLPWWQARFVRGLVGAAFGSLEVSALAESSLEVPFFGRTSTLLVLLVDRPGLAIAVILADGADAVRSSRGYPIRAEVVEVPEKTRSGPGKVRTWRVPAGPAVRIDFTGGEQWLVPTEHPTTLAELVTARARR